MCRWLAYSGASILLEDVLFKPEHSLIDQSMSAKSATTPTNADGFGVGWYSPNPTPGLYRSIRPAWNDFNLRDLAAHIQSPLFLAHVRATSLATVQETNCHPFRYGNWLFVHNGEIDGIEHIRKQLLMEIADELFPCILGTTDSEVMFYLALTLGLEADPPRALARMAGVVEAAAHAKGIDESIWMTLGVSDGRTLYAVRYASDGSAPTLFHSRDMEDVIRILPRLKEKLSPSTRVVVSEPMGNIPPLWVEVPQGSCVRVHGEEIAIEPFRPIPPGKA